MLDRILWRFLWLIIMALITATAGAGLMLAYSGLFQLVGKHVVPGATSMGMALVLSIACYLLCRHGNDLMDR
ncbi:MAG TPA: hypothetical protein VIL86_04205 [Tepidisphaeraceae bacterium]|jgi:hypothetical protein